MFFVLAHFIFTIQQSYKKLRRLFISILFIWAFPYRVGLSAISFLRKTKKDAASIPNALSAMVGLNRNVLGVLHSPVRF